MSSPELPETTVSLRWIFPFVRVTGIAPNDLQLLQRERIGLADIAKPDTRVSHTVIMELLAEAVTQFDDPCLGLRAGERFEVGDIGALEYAAQTCENLRDSILCCNRYMDLMHSAQDCRLLEEDELATWQFRITDDVPQLPAANDFVLTGALWFVRQHTGRALPLREVHVKHDAPTCAAEYARVFADAEVRYGMAHNALVFERASLTWPMAHAHHGLHAAYELHAVTMMQSLHKPRSVSGRVRELLLESLHNGDLSVRAVSARMRMSGATLRRRLAQEDSSFSGLLEEARRDLASKYLADTSLAISEVAFLLGFSHVSAFYRAFARTSPDATPAQVRARLSKSAPP